MARLVNPIHHAERRAQILTGLESAILELGFPRVTFRDVSLRSGVSQGLLNYYFSDKTEMILALQWRILEQYNDALWDVTHSMESAGSSSKRSEGDLSSQRSEGEQRLAKLFDVLLDPTPELIRTIGVFFQLEAEALTNPAVEHGMQLYIQGFQQAVERVLQGMPWWERTGEIQRRQMTLFTVSAIKGAYLQGIFPLNPEVFAATRAVLENVLTHATLARPRYADEPVVASSSKQSKPAQPIKKAAAK